MEDYLFEKVIMHPEVSKKGVSEMAEMVRIFRELLEEIVKEKPNASIQSLLNPGTAE